MALTVDQGRFAFAALDDESAVSVGLDGAVVVRQNAGGDTVESEMTEGVVQHQFDGLAAKALSEKLRVADTDGETGALVASIEVVETDLADRSVLVLDDPGVWMPLQRAIPRFGIGSGRLWSLAVSAVHPSDLGMPTQRELVIDVRRLWLAQDDALALQHARWFHAVEP